MTSRPDQLPGACRVEEMRQVKRAQEKAGKKAEKQKRKEEMDAKLAAMSEEELKAFKEGVTQRRTERRGDKQGKRQKQLQVGKQSRVRCCGPLAACCQARDCSDRYGPMLWRGVFAISQAGQAPEAAAVACAKAEARLGMQLRGHNLVGTGRASSRHAGFTYRGY